MLPVTIIAISVYLIGVNLISRIDRIHQIADAVPEIVQTEKQEEKELEIIGEKININTATESELRTLDGIGEKLAKRIIKKREELGGFKAVEQIREVEGIGQKLYDSIKDYIKAE